MTLLTLLLTDIISLSVPRLRPSVRPLSRRFPSLSVEQTRQTTARSRSLPERLWMVGGSCSTQRKTCVIKDLTSYHFACDVCGKATIRRSFLCPIKVDRAQTASDRPCSDVAAPCTELLRAWSEAWDKRDILRTREWVYHLSSSSDKGNKAESTFCFLFYGGGSTLGQPDTLTGFVLIYLFSRSHSTQLASSLTYHQFTIYGRK